jgi:cytosolic 5'-nucleotidase 3
MKTNIIIVSERELNEKIAQIVRDGKDKLHIISDFDGTLSKEFVNDKKVPSMISHLRDGSYLTPDYAEKANAFYNKYHPIEIDLSIPLEKRKRKMHEWWSTHYKLLIKSGLNKKDIERLILEDKVKLRDGIDEFLGLLNKNNIPIIIMSSSGLGDAIPMVLSKQELLYPNINIISNQFFWKDDGSALKIKEPILHSLNKKEVELKDYAFFKKVRDRKNVILLGNSISDTDMIEGFSYDNLIKIGFLNDENEVPLEEFKKAFDVVILNDGSMDYVNELVKKIIDY